MQPYKFIPQLKTVLWGGQLIAQLKNMPQTSEPIGESWEISAMPGHESVVAKGNDAGLTLNELIEQYREQLVGECVYERFGNHFPLLVKIIDAHQPLSIQVHPTDELANERHNCPGKTEMWYIIETQPQATILAGLNRELTPGQFETLSQNGLLEESLTHYHSQPGDVFFLPAGTIHSIGAGNLLVEIQQASDITYRLYDFNRVDADGKPRQLHINEARDAINYSLQSDIASHCSSTIIGETVIANCEYFNTRHLAVNGCHRLNWEPMQSFLIMVGINGTIEIVTDGSCRTSLHKGESLLVPACTSTIDVNGQGQIIMAQMPNK